jgi:hypothetical protein
MRLGKIRRIDKFFVAANATSGSLVKSLTSMKKSDFNLVATSVLFLVAYISTAASANTINVITVGSGDTALPAYVGGTAILTQTIKYDSGTGNFDPFLSVQSNRTDEWGYNTAAGNNLDAISGGNRTHLEILDDIPAVIIGGKKYREFILDTNQSGQKPISVNQIQIFGGAAATDTAYPAGGATPSNYDVSPGLGMTPLFQLNNFPSGSPNISEIQVAVVGYGSGHADMAFYVPDSAFAGIQATDYITVFTQLGLPPGHDPQSAGFEEWGVQQNSGGFGPGTAVPEPPAWAILGCAAVGIIWGLRRTIPKRI